jgi:hypothetical protein
VPWWRDAVCYQVYVRSFADSDGDGVGDLAGVRSRLAYLAELGVDAVWLTPFYRSPQADHGYDVADYRDVDPLFGSLADFDALRAEATRLGCGSSPTSCLTTPPTSTRGSRRRWPAGRAAPSATATSSVPAGARTARAAQQLEVGVRRPRLDPRRRRRVVPPPVRQAQPD